MPVIVIGADTPEGEAVLEALVHPEREVRAFVTDPDVGLVWKQRGVKVAIGDVSDASHVEAACTRCFSAVLIQTAAVDARERSFAHTPQAVMAGWAHAVSAAKVQRVIWVVEGEPPPTRNPEAAAVPIGLPAAELAARVAQLDDAARI